MKRNFKFYATIWAVVLLTFLLVVFLIQPLIPGYEIRYDAHFWIALAFIIIAFIGNLVCAWFTFKTNNLQKLFYSLPLTTISRTALTAMLIAGSVLMLIPKCPARVAAIICILIFAFNAVAVVKAVWAADAVSRIDENVKAKTSFIKNNTVNAECIMARAKSDAARTECKKVYEAMRYSDPMSSPELSVAEAKITVNMDELGKAVTMDDTLKISEIADNLVVLIGDRNKMCKALK